MPRPAKLRFDRDSHTYWHGTRRLVGVTTLLELGGLVDDWFFTEESRERGSWVHARAAEYDLGAATRVDGHEWEGYVVAYMRAMAAIPHRWTAIEQPVFRPDLGVGGCPDRVGLVRHVEGILDLKTGAPSPSHGVQLALYDLLLGGPLAGRRRRELLYLFPTGRFKALPCTDTGDYARAAELLKLAA